jgi:hypothetical protein
MPETLILTGTRGSSWHGFSMHFANSHLDLSASDPIPSAPGPFLLARVGASLSRALASRSDVRVGAFCVHPASFIGRASTEPETADLDTALDEWCESAQDLLSLWRKKRTHVDLLNWEECLACPGDFQAWFREHIGTPAASPLCVSDSAASPLEAVRLQICGAIVDSHRSAPRLWSELQAACRPLSADFRTPSPAMLRQSALAGLSSAQSGLLEASDGKSKALSQLAETRAELAELKTESDRKHQVLLQEIEDAFRESQFHFEKWKHTEAEMERREADLLARLGAMETNLHEHHLLASERDSLFEECRTLGFRLSALEADLGNAEAAKSSAYARLEAAQAELDRQISESRQIQHILLQEVRKAFQESQDHFEKWKAAEAQRDQGMAKLQALIDSMASRLSWRLGAPFRFCWEKIRNSAVKLKRLPIALRILLKHYRSGLFDHEWYFAQNPDVKATTPRPFIHFAFHGVFEDRAPHSRYNEAEYLLRNPSAKSSDHLPLVHYVLEGFQPRK